MKLFAVYEKAQCCVYFIQINWSLDTDLREGCKGITQIQIWGLKTTKKQEGTEKIVILSLIKADLSTWLILELSQQNHVQGQARILLVSEG